MWRRYLFNITLVFSLGLCGLALVGWGLMGDLKFEVFTWILKDGSVGWHEGGGFSIAGLELREYNTFVGPMVMLKIPGWFILLASLILPLYWLRRKRWHQREIF